MRINQHILISELIVKSQFKNTTVKSTGTKQFHTFWRNKIDADQNQQRKKLTNFVVFDVD